MCVAQGPLSVIVLTRAGELNCVCVSYTALPFSLRCKSDG